MKPYIITFAGPPGTSKTPIAFHLSYTFRLPIVQMDAMRMEVREDLLLADSTNPRVREEFWKRASSRYQKLLQEQVCFIDDSSADRSWKQQPDDQYYQLQKHGYDAFIISMDLSQEFISKLHGANQSVLRGEADRYYVDHQRFLELYSDDVGVHITNDNFLDRMHVCEAAISQFLDTRKR